MVLNLIPIPEGGDPLAEYLDDILLVEPMPKVPSMQEWSANQHDQIITHRATGLQFRAFPLRQPSVGGFVTPFNRSSEIALRLTNFPRGTQLPTRDRVYEIAKQGMLWIKTYTYEAARGR